MANFKRGRGDNMGVAGNLNDNADITAPVRSYWPNDYGLYNMAGNVSEWVMDVYRPELRKIMPEQIIESLEEMFLKLNLEMMKEI